MENNPHTLESGKARDPYTEPDSQGGRYRQQPGEGQNYGEQSPYTGQARDPYSGQGWQGERYLQQQGGGQNYGEQSPYSGQNYSENPFQKTDQSTSIPLTDKSIRMNFIRKVYSIVMVQIAITTLIVVLFYQHPPLEDLTSETIWLFLGALTMLVMVYWLLLYSPNILRSFPMNFIVLFLFTCLNGIMLGFLCVHVDSHIVILALGMTVIISLSLTVFAFQTSIDYTGLGPYLYSVVVSLTMMSISFIFFPPAQSTRIFYAAAGVQLYSMYLIYDTQLMLGGNHRNSYSPEDYALAAFYIYTDVITIFMKLLELLHEIRSDRG